MGVEGGYNVPLYYEALLGVRIVLYYCIPDDQLGGNAAILCI